MERVLTTIATKLRQALTLLQEEAEIAIVVVFVAAERLWHRIDTCVDTTNARTGIVVIKIIASS